MLQPGAGNDHLFVKSSYSGSGENCVEVAQASNGKVLVRHSKDLTGRHLTFTQSEWEAFLRGVKDNEFDVP